MLKYRIIEKTKTEKTRNLTSKLSEAEKINTSKTTSDAEVDILREKQSEFQLSIDKIQQEFYSAGADISRAEQAIQSERENITSSQDKLSLKNQSLSERKRQLHD